MKNFLLSMISKALNGYLGLDPLSKQRLLALQGKTVIIELLPMYFAFQLTFSENGIHIQEADPLQSADTKIRGTPLRFFGMMIMKEDRKKFFADDLVIQGQAELGQHVIELFDELEIDWEEYFSHFIGDIGAHQVHRFIRDTEKWLQHTQESVRQNISEYIHEETEWFPSHEALQDFFTDIDTLRMDVDRIDVRIKHLRQLITENEGVQ